jgi:hypothetical protein
MPLTTLQKEIASHPARFKVLCAGRRSGKTILQIHGLGRFSATKPGLPQWYIAPTTEMARDIMWEEAKRKFMKLGWTTRRKIHESLMRVRLMNNSTIFLKSGEKPDRLRGRKYGFLGIDEAGEQKETLWPIVAPGLADHQGNAWIFGTPKGRNWFYDMFMRGQDPAYPDWMSWQFTTLQAGIITPEEIERFKDEYDEYTFAQEFLATFLDMAGVIHYGFDRLLNYCPFGVEGVRDGEELLIGMDFNVNPMSAVVCVEREETFNTIDPVNGILAPRAFPVLHQVDEITIPNADTDTMSQEIRRRYGDNRKILVYPDPSGKARKTSAPVGRTDFTILENYKFDVYARKKAPMVVDRINAVNSLICSSNQLRRYRLNTKRCRNTAKSLEGWSYKEGTRVPSKGGSPDFSHLCDGLGYLIDYRYPVAQYDHQESTTEPAW